jgi:hypothetical protein
MNLTETLPPSRHKRASDLFVTFGASLRHFRSLPLEFRVPRSRAATVGYECREKASHTKTLALLHRRHAFLAAMIVGVGALAVILLVLFLYRLGYVDRYVANQINNVRKLRHTR